MSNKLCIDCKYHDASYVHVWCKHPNNGTNNVNGQLNTITAHANRLPNLGQCKPQALWFEPKPEPQPNALSKLVIKLKSFYESNFG